MKLWTNLFLPGQLQKIMDNLKKIWTIFFLIGQLTNKIVQVNNMIKLSWTIVHRGDKTQILIQTW